MAGQITSFRAPASMRLIQRLVMVVLFLCFIGFAGCAPRNPPGLNDIWWENFNKGPEAAFMYLDYCDKRCDNNRDRRIKIMKEASKEFSEYVRRSINSSNSVDELVKFLNELEFICVYYQKILACKKNTKHNRPVVFGFPDEDNPKHHHAAEWTVIASVNGPIFERSTMFVSDLAIDSVVKFARGH